MVVSNKELNCVLDRIRASISSSHVGLIPNNLKIIRDKYINGLPKVKHTHGKFDIDDDALKIVKRDGISLQNNIQPIRYKYFIFTMLQCYYVKKNAFYQLLLFLSQMWSKFQKFWRFAQFLLVLNAFLAAVKSRNQFYTNFVAKTVK